MKVKWKITIGVAAGLFATLVSVSLLFYFFRTMEMEGERITASGKVESIEFPADEPPGNAGNVDRLLDEMEFGTIAFNAPTTFNIDDSPQIQLILSLAETVEKLKQSITEEGERIGATIRVSDRMEARLSAICFKLQP